MNVGVGVEMPRYQSIKKVWALQIESVGEHQVNVVEERFAPIPLNDLPADIFARGTPSPGDYLVQYEGGYWSWSPKEPFEKGHVRL